MPREKEAYRDNLELLNQMFPEKQVLNASDVSKFSGSSRETVLRKYPMNANKQISKATLARFLS